MTFLFLVVTMTTLSIVTWLLLARGTPPAFVLGFLGLMGASAAMRYIESYLPPSADGAEAALALSEGAWGVAQYALVLFAVAAHPPVRLALLVRAMWRLFLLVLESRAIREAARILLAVATAASPAPPPAPFGTGALEAEARAFLAQSREIIALAVEVLGSVLVLAILRDLYTHLPLILWNLAHRHYHHHHHHHRYHTHSN